MKRNLLVGALYLVLVLFAAQLKAQYLVWKDSVVVLENNDTLTAAWCGGINNAQFSEIDLNFDGKKDLFVFDRSGYKISTFINTGTLGVSAYKFAPQYLSLFPKELSDWVLLYDVNCDGKEDLLTSAGNGIKVFYNQGGANQHLFVLVNPKVTSSFEGLIGNLYVSKVDIPAITDMDNDGDLDVLAFPVGGTKIEYHKNLAMENTGSCGFSDFVRFEKCWGLIEESFSTNSVFLNVSCGRSINNPDDISALQHSGSTLLALDNDGDGDKDLLLGDISFPGLTFVQNGGKIDSAIGVYVDSTFPSYNTPLDMDLFPSCYYLDVDNDGVKDLIVTPNAANASENFNCSWYYKNLGQNNHPNFDFRSVGFMRSEMMDFGEGAYPVFFDYNNDGLLDIVVGNFGYRYGNKNFSQLALYKNTGTSLSPQFALEDRDYAGLFNISKSASPSALQAFAPAFSDLDSDGDKDLLCGMADGKLLWMENVAGAGNLPVFQYKTANYGGIDAGTFSKPHFYDVNGDGRNDLIIGSSDGKFAYYQDTAVAGPAAFKLIKKPWGNIVLTDLIQQVTGYANPQLVKENNQLVLYTGTSTGWIYKFAGIENNLLGTFTVVDSVFGGVNAGSRTHLAIADLDGDNKNEFLIGNYAGGLSLFSNQPTVSIQESVLNDKLTVFPNPVNGTVQVTFPINQTYLLTLFDLAGKQIATEIAEGNQAALNLTGLQGGVYLLKVSGGTKLWQTKIVVY